jgi:hypothetical protein
MTYGIGNTGPDFACLNRLIVYSWERVLKCKKQQVHVAPKVKSQQDYSLGWRIFFIVESGVMYEHTTFVLQQHLYLSVTCDRSMVFSGYSGFLGQ